jgi:hypothetical protein
MALISERERPDSEVSVEALQLELILVSVEQWRTFKASNRNKRLLIDLAAKIFDMLMKYKSQKGKPQASQGHVASEMEVIAEFTGKLPLKLRDQVMAYARKQVRMEEAAPTR